ncbi:DNA polymerase III subunit delta [Thiorhodococcus mannitoliphagus]|uniref:DNA polymerase III subunit delta n=1 Tax=Thiorhodococcus mannitoliphagus TaxID=329406 RepID=A0A6P1DWE9_9GAMM|nr:DNA polymerase III subunit delta [Thiorhodococcus mannitoliphagus]NEX21463.1 DNA polymerase III subunit delta [Thiorhodococcus mannitoliphagus]
MQVRFNQLSGHLKSGVAPLYLLCGDEPFQFGEAARLIREKGKREGFDEREVLDAEANFDWGLLTAAAESMSLFSERKLIELRIGNGKIGKEGSEAICEYCERPCSDNLLMILAPGLERKDLTTKWAKRVEAVGALLQVWPLRERELTAWLDQRLKAAGFAPESGVAAMLAERAEGNLLAGVQEVEKLRLLHEPGPLRLDDLLGNLADSARFDLFALTDAAVCGDRARAHRVLSVLRGEGTADVLVLWVLAREIRMLADAAGAAARRASLSQVFASHRVPKMRQQGIETALRRLPLSTLRRLLQQCAEVDLTIKGLSRQDPWHQLAVIADCLCTGAPPPPARRGAAAG